MENSNQQENISMTVENVPPQASPQASPQAPPQASPQAPPQAPPQASPQAPPQEEMVTVPVGLLQNVINILDVISARGVFKPAEYAGVGGVYNNLSLLVNKQD